MNANYGQGTTYPKAKDQSSRWVLIDAKDQILGRLASEVAKRLIGKDKVNYHPAVLTGDKVIVINAQHVKLTGQKAESKEFIWHTGYTGHLRRRPFLRQMELSAPKAFLLTIRGMLPKNKLGNAMLRNLRVFADENHGMEAQRPEKIQLTL